MYFAVKALVLRLIKYVRLFSDLEEAVSKTDTF